MRRHKKSSMKGSLPPSPAVLAPSAAAWRVYAGAGCIILVTLLAYLPSLSGGFLLDDDGLLTESNLIHAPDGLYRFWFTTEPYDYWPMTNSSLWIEWRLWGLNPTGYHVTNLLLQIAAAMLVWAVLRKLSLPGAFLAALIYAVHPVNVESVAWISQRKNMLAIVFFLLSVLWYLKAEMRGEGRGERGEKKEKAEGGRRKAESSGSSSLLLPPSSLWYWLSLLAFVLAMLSKGSVAVLPVLLLGMVWWRRKVTRWDLVRTAPFFAVAAVLTCVNMWFQTHGGGSIRTAGFLERLLGAGAVVWFYLLKALWPLNLVFIYPQWQIQTDNLQWWLPLLAAIAVTLVLWRYRQGWGRPLLFAWGFFCVALVPVMGFTDVGFMKYSLVADHYQHIAILGVIALAAGAWGVWYQRSRGAMRWAACSAAVVVLGALAGLTCRQNMLYQDARALYQATLEKNPDCWVAHYNLGYCLSLSDLWPEAIEHYERALKLHPDYPEAHNNLGAALKQTGRLPEAIEHYQQALKLQPNSAEAHNNLGTALRQIGRLPEAIQHFQQVLKLRPKSPEAYENLASALAQVGRLPEAIERYEQALKLKSDYPEAHNNLGTALTRIGRLPEAIAHYEQAIKLRPDYPEAHFNLGNTLSSVGRLPEAIEHYEQVLKLKPDYPEAHHNLGLTLCTAARLPEAIEHFEQALKLKPNYPEAHADLASALVQSGRLPEAIKHYEQALKLKPDYPEVHYNWGAALCLAARLPEAIEHFEQALKLKPNFAEAHYILGNALRDVGRLPEAIEHYQQAIRLQPNFLEAYHSLTLLYAQTHQPAEAVDLARKALSIARSTGQIRIAQQIEDWLQSHQASEPSSPEKPPISERGIPSP